MLCGARSRLDVMHLRWERSQRRTEQPRLRLPILQCKTGTRVQTHRRRCADPGNTTPHLAFQRFDSTSGPSRIIRVVAADEGGVVIHATPRSKRIEYAQRIWDISALAGATSGLTSSV